jgi:hypothetical protein
MNKRNSRVPTRFGRDARFEPSPADREKPDTALEQLKQRLLRLLLEEYREPRFDQPIRVAANDAAALAWTTPYPLLVFPVLLEEKAVTARDRALRQEQIRKKSRDLMLEAE